VTVPRRNIYDITTVETVTDHDRTSQRRLRKAVLRRCVEAVFSLATTSGIKDGRVEDEGSHPSLMEPSDYFLGIGWIKKAVIPPFAPMDLDPDRFTGGKRRRESPQ